MWIVALEGPRQVAEAADGLRAATTPPYEEVLAIIRGDEEAAETFHECYGPFWESVMRFVEAARAALDEM